MDLEEFVWSNLSKKSHQQLAKLVDNYIKTATNGRDLFEILFNIYCTKLACKNMWIAGKFLEYCKSFEQNKKNISQCKTICLEIVSLFLSLDEQEVIKVDLNPVIKNKIAKISYTFDKEYQELDTFKSIFMGNIYTLMNAIYGILLCKKNIYDCCLLMKYITELKNNQIFFGSDIKSLNIYDYLFYMLDKIQIHHSIKTLIDIHKNLFYFNAKKKDYVMRENIIYICFDACINGEVIEQEIDIKPIVNSMKKTSNVSYLFTLHNYDYDIIIRMEREKTNKKNDRLFKMVDIQNCSIIDNQIKKPVDLIKTISNISK
jgi:hypothetical protein